MYSEMGLTYTKVLEIDDRELLNLHEHKVISVRKIEKYIKLLLTVT